MARWSSRQLARAAMLGLFVLTLVGGAVLLGEGGSRSVDDPAEYLAAFYADGDVEGLIRVIPAVAFGDAPVEDRRAQLTQVLRPGVGVAQVGDPEEANGVMVTPVTTEDRIVWCVGENGSVTPSCLVAVAPVTATPSDGLTVPLVDVQVQLGRPQALRLIIENPGATPFSVGTLRLTDAEGAPVEADLTESLVALPGQQPTPTGPGDATVPPGGALLLVWVSDGDLSGRTLVVGDGEPILELLVEDLRWLHR